MMATSELPETEMEFAVQMTCSSCAEDVRRVFKDQPGVNSVYVNLENELVLVRSTLPSTKVQQLLDETGKLVVFRGYGGSGQQGSVQTSSHYGAAVVIMKGTDGVKGLARMVQVAPEKCVIEGTIDGLPPGDHTIAIHEFGDLSQGCYSCGPVFTMNAVNAAYNTHDKVAGLLGHIRSDDGGRGIFHFVSETISVPSVIGRSMIVHTGISPNTTARVMCGIISQSAGLFENKKKVCTCDGVTIWDEAKKVKSGDSSKL